jgi:hypothetical protein
MATASAKWLETLVWRAPQARWGRGSLVELLQGGNRLREGECRRMGYGTGGSASGELCLPCWALSKRERSATAAHRRGKREDWGGRDVREAALRLLWTPHGELEADHLRLNHPAFSYAALGSPSRFLRRWLHSSSRAPWRRRKWWQARIAGARGDSAAE